MEGIFELKNSDDLFKKLRYDYDLLKENPLNQYLAFNFFVTAEHMLDWIYPGYKNKKKREEIRKDNVLLQICSHIANGAKHFEVNPKIHNSVSKTTKAGYFPTGYFHSNYWPKGYWPECSFICLKGQAEKEFGKSLPLLELAEKVLNFWGKNK